MGDPLHIEHPKMDYHSDAESYARGRRMVLQVMAVWGLLCFALGGFVCWAMTNISVSWK